jgi:AcrR family transcriptional regulator
MTTVLTRRERQEQTRELLLAAASVVFARRGYHEASVEEVAAEAGFSKGAVYSNFAGKQRDPDWPLLFYEFWSFGVRNAQIQEEFAKRRKAVEDALAQTLERIAAQLGFKLRFPAPVLAKAVGAALNGLAFERAADPGAIPDEVFAEFVVAVLGCSIAIGEQD